MNSPSITRKNTLLELVGPGERGQNATQLLCYDMYEGSELLVLPHEVIQMFPPHYWILKVAQEDWSIETSFFIDFNSF
jgi:hypothetical protein